MVRILPGGLRRSKDFACNRIPASTYSFARSPFFTERDTKDLIELAAEQNFLDGEAARKALGSERPTVQKLVRMGLLASGYVDPLLERYHDQLSRALRAYEGTPATCGRCGRPMDRQRDEVSCDPCGIRVQILKPEPAAGGLPPEVADAARDPTNRVGRYVTYRKLGEGAFGAVLLAWDTQLSRPVALKFLKGQDPADETRFRREASLAAGLTHPNIAAVFEVGDDPAYIAMQYVDGKPASRLDLTVRESVRVVKAAAEAVQTAHIQGIIHRDLKPGNIMVDKTGRVYVMDFGLAKRVGIESEVSQSGMVVGTPAFMSPEQASGHVHLDAQTDVYALGATLYALVTGRAPFRGIPVEVMRKVVYEDPPTPKVDRDLRTILERAMDKVSARRYPSARALAEDLGRYLAGEPVQSRPSSMGYKLWKRAARNRALVGMGAAVVVAAVVLLIVTLLLMREREAALLSMRERARTNLRAALDLRREGNLEKMKEYLPGLEEACLEAIDRAPELAEPHYHLGRMQRAMMRFDLALEQQEEALGKEPDYGPGLYERAILLSLKVRGRLGALQQAAMEAAGRDPLGGVPIRLPAWRLAATDTTLRHLKARILNDLRNLKKAEDVPPSHVLCAEGILFLYEEKFAEAKLKLEEAVSQDRYLEEAYEALAQACLAQGAYEDAILWSGRGHELDKGYVPHLMIRAAARIRWARVKQSQGDDPGPTYRAVIEEDFTAAIDLDPESAEAYLKRGITRVNWGNYRQSRGKDPRPQYQRAIEDDFTPAIGLGQENVEAYLRRGQARVNWGVYRDRHGEDPRAQYRAAIEKDYARAIGLDSRNAEAHMSRGMAHVNWGNHELRIEGNPEKYYREAIEKDYAEAINLDREYAEAHQRRGEARVNWGNTRLIQGEDPTDYYRDAIEKDYAEAIKHDHDNAEAHLRLGEARVNWGHYTKTLDKDPSPLYRKAIDEGFAVALSLNSNYPDAWMGQGNAYLGLGQYRKEQGMDSTDYFLKGIEQGYQKAIDLDPGSAEALMRRGLATLIGLDQPKKAWADFQKALKIDPRYAFERQWEGFIKDARERAGESGY